MINTNMRLYDVYTIGLNDEYGQPVVSSEPTGTIKMSIFLTNKSIQENINYSGAKYIGLTLGSISDKNEVDYNGERLKVLYVYPNGNYKQVFLASK